LFRPSDIAKLGKKKPMEEDSSIGVKYLKVLRKVLIFSGYVVKVFPVWMKVFESLMKVFRLGEQHSPLNKNPDNLANTQSYRGENN
jgi:hypothetical protein